MSLVPYRPSVPARVVPRAPRVLPGGRMTGPIIGGRTRFGGWRGFILAAREVRRRNREDAMNDRWQQAIAASEQYRNVRVLPALQPRTRR